MVFIYEPGRNPGAFATNEKVFNKANAAQADIVSYENSAGALIGNTGGRITIDIETIQDDFNDGDIIYGSITDKILDIADIRATGLEPLELNQYVHAVSTIELDIANIVRDGGYNGDFSAGDLVYLLQGTIIKEPGFTAWFGKSHYLYGTRSSGRKLPPRSSAC